MSGYDRSSIHTFWKDVFIRQQTNFGLEERKESRHRSVSSIHLAQGIWTSIPAHCIVPDGSSLTRRKSFRKINLDLVPGTLVSDRDLSDLSPLKRVALASFSENVESISSGSQRSNRPTTTNVRTIEAGQVLEACRCSHITISPRVRAATARCGSGGDGSWSHWGSGWVRGWVRRWFRRWLPPPPKRVSSKRVKGRKSRPHGYGLSRNHEGLHFDSELQLDFCKL